MDKIPQHIFDEFERIAGEVLGIETLKTRNSDRLDFYDCSVASLVDALYKAYQSGYDRGWVDAEDINLF